MFKSQAFHPIFNFSFGGGKKSDFVLVLQSKMPMKILDHNRMFVHSQTI